MGISVLLPTAVPVAILAVICLMRNMTLPFNINSVSPKKFWGENSP